MSRKVILDRVKTALGRRSGQPPATPPEARIRIPEVSAAERIEQFRGALEKLAGCFHVAGSKADARAYVERVLAGRAAVASNSPYLAECGVTALKGVRSFFTREGELREVAASADAGITSADYGLADTGTLVMLSSISEARMISLLPPIHIAVIPREIILTGLDELFTVLPNPAEAASSMVLITGPSRTADIEQNLVRGVHGPGEVHVVVV